MMVCFGLESRQRQVEAVRILVQSFVDSVALKSLVHEVSSVVLEVPWMQLSGAGVVPVLIDEGWWVENYCC